MIPVMISEMDAGTPRDVWMLDAPLESTASMSEIAIMAKGLS